MHILFLTDNFYPEVNAPASRTYEHCKVWVQAGHKVTVITGVPNFPKGQVYSGYKNRLVQKEDIDGIKVIRVWTFIAANEGTFKRTLDFASFMITSFFASLFVKRPDIVVGTSPQFFTVCAACATATIRRVPWIFELRDLWPESIKVIFGLNDNLILRLLEKLELWLYHKADGIISVTESFRTEISYRGIDCKKIHVITNGVDTLRFVKREKDLDLLNRLGIQGKFLLGYIGTHGLAHGLDTLLDAAQIIQKSRHKNKFHFILLGDGAEKNKLKLKAEKLLLNNVSFVDTVSKDEVVRFWSVLDASIIHLKNRELFKTVIPSKIFECMSMGIPILHGVRGESAEIVKNADVGRLFEPENAEELVEAIYVLQSSTNLRSKLSKNCIGASKNYDRNLLALQMLDVIEKVVKGKN